MEQPEYLSDRQVAARYGVTRPTIWRWTRDGDIPQPYRFGKQTTRWSRAELEAHDASQRPQSQATGPGTRRREEAQAAG